MHLLYSCVRQSEGQLEHEHLHKGFNGSVDGSGCLQNAVGGRDLLRGVMCDDFCILHSMNYA